MEEKFMPDNTIICPNCGHHIAVEEAFLHQAGERIRKEYEVKQREQEAIFLRKRNDLENERKEFEEKKLRENELFHEKLEARLKEATEKLKERASAESAQRLKALEDEIENRKKENTALKQKEIEFLRKENALKEKEEQLQLDFERKFLLQRDVLASEIRKQEAERYDLKFKEYEKRLEDHKKMIDEMKRKAEQGSMQLQGEVQELALEDLLHATFPHDIIHEVPKGIKGADVIQTVINPLQQVCGTIIFESKRTKTFSESWIEKLKEDQRDTGANLAVIVTEALPKDMERFGRKEGVWICTYHEATSLIFVLRELLIREQSIRAATENRGGKMELLYAFLISDEFHHQIDGIVEGFSSLKTELDREKRAMQRIWKEREKQIEKVISNTIDMHTSIRSIAGNAIAPVQSLELHITTSESELEIDQD